MNCLIGRFSYDDHTITIYVTFDVIVIHWCDSVWQLSLLLLMLSSFATSSVLLCFWRGLPLTQRLNILQKHIVPLQTLKPVYEPFHQHFLFYTCMPATLSIKGTFFQIFHIYYRSAIATIINFTIKISMNFTWWKNDVSFQMIPFSTFPPGRFTFLNGISQESLETLVLH